ncbi:hematopoietic prostaglandin D synthase-like [Styela clava]
MSSYTYKLYYFNSRGRAEMIRWIFAAADVKYEDIRLDKEQWAKKKSEMPFGQMPVLEVIDGNGTSTLIAESRAIERFLIKQFNLDGETDLDCAKIDSIQEYMSDLFRKMPFFESDLQKKEKLMKEAFEGPVAKAYEIVESQVGSSKYFLGEKLTWFDLAITAGSDVLLMFNPNLFEKYPKLKKLHSTVRCHPNISAWIAKRPQTPY